MLRIGVRELRQHASHYLARVKAGETIEVTERGRLIALVTPPREMTALERLIAEGKIIPATAPFQLPEPISLTPGGPSLAEILDEQREERFP